MSPLLRHLCLHSSVSHSSMSPLCHHAGWRLIAPTGVSGEKATATGLERSPNIVHGCAFPKQLAVSESWWLSDGRSDQRPQQVGRQSGSHNSTQEHIFGTQIQITQPDKPPPLYPSGWLLPHDDKGRCVGVTSVRHSAVVQPDDQTKNPDISHQTHMKPTGPTTSAEPLCISGVVHNRWA